MLAYHNSVFLLFVVDWFAIALESIDQVSKEMDSLFGHFCWCYQSFLGSLYLILLSFHTFCTNGHHRATSFDMF